jgi:hypothetical protein
LENEALKPKIMLFLCTGNYYRSRFAELLFNHLAKQRGLDWQATSRGLGKMAVILKPPILLCFHHALVKRKHRLLYSRESARAPDPKVRQKNSLPEFQVRAKCFCGAQSAPITFVSHPVGDEGNSISSASSNSQFGPIQMYHSACGSIHRLTRRTLAAPMQ